MSTYEHLKYNNNKIQVDSAIRDGGGLEISKHYAKNDQIKIFAITEDIVTVTTDTTKGVSPYSTSYGYTNIEINKDAGISWVEGALYTFTVNTKMVVNSSYRNVRIRIGGATDGDSWHPIMGDSSILTGSSYLTKSSTRTYQYKSTYINTGGLHLCTDSNTTYAYLVNTFTAGELQIDAGGFGARYSLVFPTTPEGTINETYSSLVTTSATSTSKKVFGDLTFYANRPPQYIYSASIEGGAASANATYETYTTTDIRYTANTSATYVSTLKRVFLYLKDYDPVISSFKADATIGNIMSIDKIATRFPSTTEGYVYLYFLGTNTTNWYALTPNRQQKDVIYRYHPSTGELKIMTNAQDAVTLNGQSADYYLNYNNISNTPSIPTTTNELTNNSGFITTTKITSTDLTLTEVD